MQRKVLLDLCDVILILEGEMAKYAAVTDSEEFVDRWQSCRNEYLSLLTWLENQP